MAHAEMLTIHSSMKCSEGCRDAADGAALVADSQATWPVRLNCQCLMGLMVFVTLQHVIGFPPISCRLLQWTWPRLAALLGQRSEQMDSEYRATLSSLGSRAAAHVEQVCQHSLAHPSYSKEGRRWNWKLTPGG
eukprot:2890858-Amphidinium_carterae.1